MIFEASGKIDVKQYILTLSWCSSPERPWQLKTKTNKKHNLYFSFSYTTPITLHYTTLITVHYTNYNYTTTKTTTAITTTATATTTTTLHCATLH